MTLHSSNVVPSHSAPVVGNRSAQPTRRFFDDLKIGLSVWLLTNIIVLGGGVFGWMYLQHRGHRPDNPIGAFAHWDGDWYRSIVEKGYSYTPNQQSNVAFFPAFPLAGRGVAWLTGLSSVTSLFLAAQIFLAAGLVVFHAYLRRRIFVDDPIAASMALLVFALFPPTFFFHIVYSESLFFLLAAAILLAVETRSPLIVLAFLVGLATAARPVGVAFLPIVLREIWRRSDSWKTLVVRCAVLLPLSLWGLIAYGSYLADSVGDPFAFIKVQEAWSWHPNSPWQQKATALLTFRPIWGAFDPNSGHFFPSDVEPNYMPFGVSGPNAMLFVFGLFLVVYGAWKRRLNTTELLVAAGLLGIPYLTRGFESQFLSFARFTAVVLPIYLPLALLVSRLSRFWQIAYLLLCAWGMTLCAALFGAGHPLV